MAKIQFIITDLETGGAEMMLYKLISQIDREMYSPRVISLTNDGFFGDRLRDIDIPVESLGMRRGMPDIGSFFRLLAMLRGNAPDLIQTWMYHADLIGGLAGKLVGGTPILWNIRNSDLDAQRSKKTTIMTVKTCAMFSRNIPERIICCAESAKHLHESIGYAPDKFQVIPNGFNVTEFTRVEGARSDVCKELGIPPESFIVGLVGRFDPQKDHSNFIEAAALLKNKFHIHYILCGIGVDWNNEELVNHIKDFDLAGSFHLLGRRTDMPRITSAFDVACSSSAYGEAFSNALGEAMACEVPCVSTDVGDARLILGNTGKVVPKESPAELAGALEQMLEMGSEERRHLGSRARHRVVENFSLDSVVRQYQEVYTNVLQQKLQGNLCLNVKGEK